VYSLEVEKRGLIAYDDKRVLLTNLDNGEPNPYTHAYGHYSLAEDIQVEENDEHPDAGNELHIDTREQRQEARLHRKHQLAVKRATRPFQQMSSDEDEDEVQGDDLIRAQRAAAARPGTTIRMNDVIEQICARQNLQRPSSPPPLMPIERAGKLIFDTLINMIDMSIISYRTQRDEQAASISADAPRHLFIRRGGARATSLAASPSASRLEDRG
jgi:hypothetical protein